LSDYHEILQLTAPDDYCGIAFVRGHFQNTPDAILARAQRPDVSGIKGSFGVQIHPDSRFELGEKQAQGLVNFRWPYIQYDLRKKAAFHDGNSGTYEEISFVKDGTVFQIARIKWGRGSSVSNFSSSTNPPETENIMLKSGGEIQFGCPCSNGGPPIIDSFRVQFGNDKLSCFSEMYQKRLDIQMFVDNRPQELGPTLLTPDGLKVQVPDLSRTHETELSVGKPTIIVSAYALREGALADNAGGSEQLGKFFEDIEDYLGISNTSLNMTDRLWTALCSTNYESSEAVEFCVVGRCVEQILCVSTVPVPSTAQEGAASVHNPISLETTENTNQETAEDCTKEIPIALVRNIITSQYVDVQSSL
jgi:hypothetical protein